MKDLLGISGCKDSELVDVAKDRGMLL